MPSTMPSRLLPCRRCAALLPADARSCQLCGIAHPHTPAWGTALFFALFLLVILIGRLSC
jgi:hypothetical protein